jgi:hypothetical protein
VHSPFATGLPDGSGPTGPVKRQPERETGLEPAT